MADSLKNDIVNVEFAAGEQPSSSKLTGMVAQLKTAVSRISSAIGDLYTEQTHMSGAGAYSLEERPTVGPNLSRLLGSAGWLNPRQLGRIRETYEVTFIAGHPVGGKHFRRKMFKLPYPAILFQDSGTAVETPIGTDIWLSDSLGDYKYNPSYNDLATWAFGVASGYSDVVTAGSTQKINAASGQVTRLENLVSAGQWYLDYQEGILYLAEGLERKSGSGDSITWTGVNPAWWYFSDAGTTFTTADIGRTITISGATNPTNNGSFEIYDYATPTSVVFINAAAVIENPFSGAWEIVEGFTLTYRCDTLNDSYDGATFNVIPDEAQTDPLCTVVLISGSTYEITTPNSIESYGLHGDVWDGPGGPLTLDNTLFPRDKTAEESDYTYVSPDNAMGTNPIRLPYALTSNLSAGDVIPEGYMKIWDATDGKVLSGGEFTYISDNVVRCTGIALIAGSTRYRLVVPGTNALRTLYHLRQGYFNHRHTGTFGVDFNFDGHRLSHAELIHLFDEGDTREGLNGFGPSTLGVYRNPHPMYLHRYGYKYANSIDDTLNKDNALLGDLVLAAIDDDLDLSADSRKIIFGHPSTGPTMYYDQSDDRFNIINSIIYNNMGIRLNPLFLPSYSDTPDPNSLYAKNICKCWGMFNCDGAGVGAAITIQTGFNIDTVTISDRGGTFVFTVTFLTPMATVNYGVTATLAVNAAGDAATGYHPVIFGSTRHTTYFDIIIASSVAAVDCKGVKTDVSFNVWGTN